MTFEEIQPFARYVRMLEISENSKFEPVMPLDARLFYVQSGRETVFVEDTAMTLSAGDLLYVNSGVIYELCSQKASVIAVNFDFTQAHKRLNQPIAPEPAARTKKNRIIQHEEFSDAPLLRSYVLVRNCRGAEHDLIHLLDAFEKKGRFSAVETSSLLTLILIKTVSIANEGKEQKSPDIDGIIAYIRDNYADAKLDNHRIAGAFGYHPNYLNAVFKRVVGCSLHAYLLQTRVAVSVSLIECGEYSIAQIAYACGFADANYFSKAFKRIVGCSPTDFKGRID